eukprot:TRINITY_DN6924_c0_g1_i2.p1 TRINITY_DN6924_c0_g1~~TRINITY_DN6924_c0_g1_i2.p1  ORF type:complete len:548 (-),score=100.03 TRINITY_DN6924_c0_g1_i2:23-1666(-)
MMVEEQSDVSFDDDVIAEQLFGPLPPPGAPPVVCADADTIRDFIAEQLFGPLPPPGAPPVVCADADTSRGNAVTSVPDVRECKAVLSAAGASLESGVRTSPQPGSADDGAGKGDSGMSRAIFASATESPVIANTSSSSLSSYAGSCSSTTGTCTSVGEPTVTIQLVAPVWPKAGFPCVDRNSIWDIADIADDSEARELESTREWQAVFSEQLAQLRFSSEKSRDALRDKRARDALADSLERSSQVAVAEMEALRAKNRALRQQLRDVIMQLQVFVKPDGPRCKAKDVTWDARRGVWQAVLSTGEGWTHIKKTPKDLTVDEMERTRLAVLAELLVLHHQQIQDSALVANFGLQPSEGAEAATGSGRPELRTSMKRWRSGCLKAATNARNKRSEKSQQQDEIANPPDAEAQDVSEVTSEVGERAKKLLESLPTNSAVTNARQKLRRRRATKHASEASKESAEVAEVDETQQAADTHCKEAHEELADRQKRRRRKRLLTGGITLHKGARRLSPVAGHAKARRVRTKAGAPLRGRRPRRMKRSGRGRVPRR